MDNFQIKNRNNSASSDATDIDLDEIAKMIDPLDDLEDNLFSAKARSTSIRNVQTTSKKVLTGEGKSLTRKDGEEIEILTSMSSNNGQTNLKVKEDNLSTRLINQQNEKQEEIMSAENHKNRVGKQGADNKAHAADSNMSNAHEEKVNSNFQTGLWSGDDLWNIGGNTEKMKHTTAKSPLISPVKSHKDIVPEGRFGSFTSSSKSPVKENPVFGERKRSNNQGSRGNENKKPGKFDWLGLLDDSDDEKQHSLKSNSKGASLKEESNEIPSHMSGMKNDLLEDDWDLGKQEDSKGAPKYTRGADSNSDHQTKLSKSSLNEGSNHAIPQTFAKTTESKLQQKMSSLLSEGDGALEAFKNVNKPKGDRGKENESSSHHSLAKDMSSVGIDLNVSSSKRDGRRKGLELDRPNEKLSLGKRGSISEENEGSSTHGYAPTFLGDQSEGSGRRRRRKDSKEVGAGMRENFSANFDPLGLFLMDDKDQIEVNKSEKKSLPDWLTGAKTKPAVEQLDASPIERKEERSNDVGSQKEIPMDRKIDSVSEQMKETTSKSSSSMKEPRGKGVAITKEANLVMPNASNDEDESAEVRNATKSITDIKSDLMEIKVESKKNTEEVLVSPKKPLDEISNRKSTSPQFKMSSIENVQRSRNVTKKNVLQLGNGYDRISSDGEECKEKLESHSEYEKKIKKPAVKIKGYHRVKKNGISDEEGEDSSISIKNAPISISSDRFAAKEKYYLRKIRDLEEKAIHVEYLEDELAKMNYMKGELEHLRAVIHVLEMEKSAAESLVTSLQERHAEQIKRLEEVHRNEVETLKDTLLREEKRGTEEVRRLAEDHRKTLDRLMEANVRMEEEFRNRMLEARKDWNRDVEAMRQAYQQSSNAAITNASLAVLTGRGLGIMENKDKSEASRREDSSIKSLSQCPEEVKELNHTVERVESILMQTLEAITPKAKNQNSNHVFNDDTEEGSDQKGKIHKPVGTRKRVYYKLRSSGKPRKAAHSLKGTRARHIASDECTEEILDSDSSQQVGGVSSRDSATRCYSSNGRIKHRGKVLEGVCQYCKRCKHCRKDSSSANTNGNDGHWQKSDKEGKNMREYHKEYLREDQQKGDDIGEQNLRQANDSFWQYKRQARGNLFPSKASRALDDDLFPSMYTPIQPSVIIDPKQYLMKLAAGNRNNLFQSSDFLNV